MKQSLKTLKDYTVETNDHLTGKIKDFLFDDKQWVIRYIDVDFGTLFSPYKILVPKVFMDTPDNDNKKIPIKLGKKNFDKCPKIEDHLPVSRKYEEELHNHYKINPYWGVAHLASTGGYFPPRPVVAPTKDDKIVDEEDLGTILRSFTEIERYSIETNDGNIGHIEDLIVDIEDWQNIYAVIDTSNWLPWSKKVLIPINNMTKISYNKQVVKINLRTDTIKNAPEYDPNKILDEKFEKGMLDFYSHSLIV